MSTAAIQRSRRAISSRRAARQSTGPRTAEGKSASRFNALTHGVYAREAVLPNESSADWEAHLQDFIRDCRPVGQEELAAVSQMAEAVWRLRRVNTVEASLFSGAQNPAAHLLEGKNGSLFAELSKQYGRYNRSFHAAQKKLTELQQKRRFSEALHARRQPAESLPAGQASFAPPAPNDTAPSRASGFPAPAVPSDYPPGAATIQSL